MSGRQSCGASFPDLGECGRNAGHEGRHEHYTLIGSRRGDAVYHTFGWTDEQAEAAAARTNEPFDLSAELGKLGIRGPRAAS